MAETVATPTTSATHATAKTHATAATYEIIATPATQCIYRRYTFNPIKKIVNLGCHYE